MNNRQPSFLLVKITIILLFIDPIRPSVQETPKSSIIDKDTIFKIADANGNVTGQNYQFQKKNWMIHLHLLDKGCQLRLRYKDNDEFLLVLQNPANTDKQSISNGDYVYWFWDPIFVETGLIKLQENQVLGEEQCKQLTAFSDKTLEQETDLESKLKSELGLELDRERLRESPFNMELYSFPNIDFKELQEMFDFKDKEMISFLDSFEEKVNVRKADTVVSDLKQSSLGEINQFLGKTKEAFVEYCQAKIEQHSTVGPNR